MVFIEQACSSSSESMLIRVFSSESMLIFKNIVIIIIYTAGARKYFVFSFSGDIGNTRYKFEDDPVCGLTTGGNENCEWDCTNKYYGVPYYPQPECFIDCFEDNHCGKKAIQEYIDAGGLCGGSSSYNLFENYGNISPNVECQYIETIDDNGKTLTFTTVGIFSEETLALLKEDQCILDVYKKSPKLSNTFAYLIYTSSDLETYKLWFSFNARNIRGLSEDDIQAALPQIPMQPRLQPGLRYLTVLNHLTYLCE